MVPERDDVGARAQQPVGQLRRDARAVRNVLAVDDADVRAGVVPQSGETLLDRPPPGLPEDVGEEEDSQFRTSAAAGRISTETWFPESFV